MYLLFFNLAYCIENLCLLLMSYVHVSRSVNNIAVFISILSSISYGANWNFLDQKTNIL